MNEMWVQTKRLGYMGVKISMAISYDKALCSPTSAV